MSKLEVKKWIKCADRMPAENENVLVYFPVLKSSTVAYLVHDWQKNPIHFAVVDFCEYDQVLCLEDISHWMPLPAYPE